MLLSKLLLLPGAIAATVEVYVHSLPSPDVPESAASRPDPLATIDYDISTLTGSLVAYNPPTGSYAPDHLLRIGLTEPESGQWHGVVTSAASFEQDWKKKFTLHVDENGKPYHVGFGTSARGQGEEVVVEIVQRQAGSKPVLNRPIVLNAEGKLDNKEPEKSFLQKYWWMLALFLLVQVVAGGGKE